MCAWLLAILLWQPAGLRAPAVAAAAIVSSILSGRGGDAAQLEQGVETIHVTARDGAYDATVHMRGGDYRIDVVLDGADYAFGRSADLRWRRTPSGSVRIVRSDVQGDVLDRWPRSVFGLDLAACDSAGSATLSGAQLWVLACRTGGDPALFYYVDPANGRVLREVSREGSRVVTYDFDDFRSTGSWTQPYHWRISGADGAADVTVTSVKPRAAPDDAMEIPASIADQFKLPAGGTSLIPAHFAHWIEVPVEIDGQKRTFIIDTGTTQTIIDIGEAARLGLNPKFGHAIVPQLRVGDAIAKRLPVEAIDLFGGRTEGILGNEFFTGHIVHIDYARGRVELISHALFEPPKDAQRIEVDYREGLPITAAIAAGTQGERFALDTGSYWIMISRSFLERSRLLPTAIPGFDSRTVSFLEGPVLSRLEVIPSFTFAGYRFDSPNAEIEQASADNTDFPLDGIIGANVLSVFDLWFDYDDGVLWAR